MLDIFLNIPCEVRSVCKRHMAVDKVDRVAMLLKCLLAVLKTWVQFPRELMSDHFDVACCDVGARLQSVQPMRTHPVNSLIAMD